MNFAKFLRAPFFVEHLWWLLLKREKYSSDSTSVRLHIWQIRCSRGALSYFPATKTNLHEADLTFVTAAQFTKLFVLIYFWWLQLYFKIQKKRLV